MPVVAPGKWWVCSGKTPTCKVSHIARGHSGRCWAGGVGEGGHTRLPRQTAPHPEAALEPRGPPTPPTGPSILALGGSRPEVASCRPCRPTPLEEASGHPHLGTQRAVCLGEQTRGAKAEPAPRPGRWLPLAGVWVQRHLRDVPLPWGPVHVAHDALHHPLDALAHSLAAEKAGVSWGRPGPQGGARAPLTP